MVYSRGAAKDITNFNFVEPLLVNKRNYLEVWKRSPCVINKVVNINLKFKGLTSLIESTPKNSPSKHHPSK